MSGEKVGQLLKSVRPSITVDIPNIVNFPLFNFSMTARNLGLLASDLEIIQNEPGLTVLHDGYLKILNDVCLNFGKLDKDITELEKNCQEILSKANQLPSNERRPLVYVTYQKVKAFEWSLKIADFFRSKTFWGSVNSRCSSLDNNDETLKRLSELQDYWLEQGEFVTFSSPLIKKVLTTYFPFLENYIKNAEWQLKYHEKLLKAWPIFLENFNQYLKILNNVLNLKKQQLINSLLARIKLVIKEFSLTEESNLVDDDIIHDFYSLFLPHGQLIPDDKKCLKAYPRKHELTVELLEYFIGFILDRGDVEDKQHLEKLFSSSTTERNGNQKYSLPTF